MIFRVQGVIIDPMYARSDKISKYLAELRNDWCSLFFQNIELSRDQHTVYVKPEIVVEIAFSDVQQSPHYPGGMALRFARVKRYRPDKSPDQASTIAQVRAIFDAARSVS